MRLKNLILVMLSLVFCISASSQASDLISVYNKAVQSDPTFKQAEANWHANRENVALARAAYLPTIDLTADIGRDYSRTLPVKVAGDGHSWGLDYGVSLSQAVFNLPAWNAIRGAKATFKADTATYLAAIQDLIERTASAYFAVLNANDTLRYTIANKKAVYRQLVAARQKYKVGLIAVTGVYDAEATYDKTVATEIENRNDLYAKLEDLSTITGEHYSSLKGISAQVPLMMPAPARIDSWVRTAEKQNYALQAQNYTVIAARDAIKQNKSSWAPSVNAQLGYQVSKTGNRLGDDNLLGSETGNLGLSLDLKPYQGGKTIASIRQARYQYSAALGGLELTHRTVVASTRKDYLDIRSGISRIKADKQAIESAEKALKATEAGYSVGTRTMVDVLNDLSTLYDQQQQYSNDQYGYMESIVDLKQQAGTLSIDDVKQLNAWLTQSVTFQLDALKKSPTHRAVNTHTQQHFLHRVKNKNNKVTGVASAGKMYAIQVFATSSRASAKQFIKDKANQLVAVRLVKKAGLYKVYTGSYKTYAEAQKALQSLPSSIKLTKPWVTTRP